MGLRHKAFVEVTYSDFAAILLSLLKEAWHFLPWALSLDKSEQFACIQTHIFSNRSSSHDVTVAMLVLLLLIQKLGIYLWRCSQKQQGMTKFEFSNSERLSYFPFTQALESFESFVRCIVSLDLLSWSRVIPWASKRLRIEVCCLSILDGSRRKLTGLTIHIGLQDGKAQANSNVHSCLMRTCSHIRTSWNWVCVHVYIIQCA